MKCVYRITNKLNGRVYIGSTRDLRNRRTIHLGELQRGIHDNPLMQADYCSREQWLFDILEEVSEEDKLLERETFYIKMFFDNGNKCYNLQDSADKSEAMSTRWATKEYRDKIVPLMKGSKTPEGIEANKVALKKRWADPSYREAQGRKISQGLLNSNHIISQETKDIKARQATEQWANPELRALHMAIRSSDEYRIKLSAAKKESCKAKTKKVTLISPEGKEYAVDNIKDFCENNPALNLGWAGMYRMVAGKTQAYKGWTLKQ